MGFAIDDVWLGNPPANANTVLRLLSTGNIEFHSSTGQHIATLTPAQVADLPSRAQMQLQIDQLQAQINTLSARLTALEDFQTSTFQPTGTDLKVLKRLIPMEGLRQPPHPDPTKESNGLFIYDDNGDGRLVLRNYGTASMIYSRGGNGVYDVVRINKRDDMNDASEA